MLGNCCLLAVGYYIVLPSTSVASAGMLTVATWKTFYLSTVGNSCNRLFQFPLLEPWLSISCPVSATSAFRGLYGWISLHMREKEHIASDHPRYYSVRCDCLKLGKSNQTGGLEEQQIHFWHNLYYGKSSSLAQFDRYWCTSQEHEVKSDLMCWNAHSTPTSYRNKR